MTPTSAPAVLDAEPVSARSASTSDLHNLLNNGSYRVKEEHALIQRRTVEPAATQSAQSPFNAKARDVESLREIASAEELGQSAYEEDVPHRNDLPPREELPYGPAKLTHAERVDLMEELREKRKKQAEAQAKVAQTASSGNRTETPGNLR